MTSKSPHGAAEPPPPPVAGKVSVESKFGRGIVPSVVMGWTVVSGSATVVATAGVVVEGAMLVVVTAIVVVVGAIVVVVGATVVVVAGGLTTTVSCASPQVPETALLFASPE